MVGFLIQKFHCQSHEFTDVYFKPDLVVLAWLVPKISIKTYNGWKSKSRKNSLPSRDVTKSIFSPFPFSQHIFWVYWAREPRLVSKCSVLFIFQNLSSNGKDFSKHKWKNSPSPRFKMKTEVNFMLICALAKMRLWDTLHYTPQISC